MNICLRFYSKIWSIGKMKKKEDRFGYPMDFRAYFTRGIIWGQRQVFSKLFNGINDHRPIPPDFKGDEASGVIRKLIELKKPCFVTRLGCVELDAVLRGYDKMDTRNPVVKLGRLFTGGNGPFWWDNSIRKNMLCTTGVFPATDAILERFSLQYLEDFKQIDVLGSWNARELELKKRFFPDAKAVFLEDLEPFFMKVPWTAALKGKRVLVINPFSETIASQYERRDVLFKTNDVLPDFELITYRPVTSFLGIKTPFADWFEAFEMMKADISRIEFDVAILECGAYGFSLGAFIKRDLQKQAVCLGGVTQLLFGIKGGRWDVREKYASMYNEFWVRPSENERPKNFLQHEDGAYW